MNHLLLASVNIGSETPLANNKTLNFYSNTSQIVSPLLKNFLTIAGIIFVILIIAGGIGMMASAGKNDPKKAEASQKTITSAIIGFVVVFCAYFIIQIIEVLTGVKILESGL
jgi:TRAP-type C4-dicarboxylate transport system permease small subunit